MPTCIQRPLGGGSIRPPSCAAPAGLRKVDSGHRSAIDYPRRSVPMRFRPLLILGLSLSIVGLARPALAQAPGTLTIGVHVTLVNRWLDPAEAEGLITPFMVFYALHDALVKPMPGNINTPSLAESFA